MRMPIFFGVAVGGVAFALTGCNIPLTKSEQDFGNSVRTMVEAQKVQQAPPAQPSTMDGVKTEQILKAYRQDVAKPTEIKNEIQINVGNK